MTESAKITNVSDTAFWVAYYRARETQRNDALFKDPLAEKLIGERGKRFSDSMGHISRYTEWAVLSRTVIIDRFIESAIRKGVDAVLNLGAGLDTRPYRMNLPKDFQWIEADYPNIIAHKSEILRSETPRCQLTRFEVDLADSSQRREFLENVVPQAKKVLVLTEGVIPYLSPEQVRALAQDLHAQPRLTYWITEFLAPRTYRYLKTTARMKAMQNSPFLFYPEDWYGFFKDAGWVEKETRYSGEIAVEFRRRPPMPAWAKIIYPLLPKKLKEQSMRMSGYILFQPSNRTEKQK